MNQVSELSTGTGFVCALFWQGASECSTLLIWAGCCEQQGPPLDGSPRTVMVTVCVAPIRGCYRVQMGEKSFLCHVNP